MAFHDEGLLAAAKAVVLPDNCKNLIEHERKSLEYLLHSPVGEGPAVLDEADSLIDLSDAAAPKAASAF